MRIRVILKFLGLISLIITGCMAVPFVLYAFRDGSNAFAASVAVGFAASGALYFCGRGADMSRIGAGEAFASVTGAWVAASAIGACPYFLYGAVPSFTDAFFESMSGFTTTGASVFAQIDGLPRSILLWRSITHWLGGMGIIGLTLAMMPIAGTGGFQMYSAESPGMTHEKITPRLQQTALCLWGVYAGLTAALTLMLALGGMSFFDAVNHSMATMATGGFSTRSASVAYYGSPYIEWVLAIFMFLAGANFVLHFYALRGRSLRHYFADPEFRFYAVSVSALSLMVAADLFLARGGSFAGALRTAAFHVTSMVTTTGFVADDYELWPHFSRGIIFICLFLGGCAGSTAGGIKHVRLLAMWNAVALRAKQPLNPRAVVAVPVGATALDPAVMSSCMAFLGLYFIVFIAGAFAASLFEPDFVTALSGAATTLGNVGPAFGGLGATDNFSGQAAPAKWVYSFLMLCGRLELYTVFALIGEIFRRVRRDSIMAGGVND